MAPFVSWDEELTYEETISLLRTLALSHARKGGEQGQQIAALLNSGNYTDLCDFPFRYGPNDDVSHLIHARQALAFIVKLEDLELGVDKDAVAMRKFAESELLCKSTNEFFAAQLRGGLNFCPDVGRLIESMRRKIARVLGPAPALGDVDLKLGPGATTQITKRYASVQNKLASKLSCSYDLMCSGYLPVLLRQLPHLSAAHAASVGIDDEGWLYERVPVEINPGRLEFVPKTARETRSIVVEPMLNGIVQLGLGALIARRLKAAGIDLSDQSRNRELARLGSVTGELATLDLSSASDTIATQLVRTLLPAAWYDLLSSFRTGEVIHGKDRDCIHLEKFSSMGNGFTFPLESLIFWALTRTQCPHGEVSVYGDDIICPAEFAGDVIWGLGVCGFVVNTTKSYWSGPFRESCGGDYFKGINIRPHYQKKLVSAEGLYVMHNFFYRLGDYESADEVLQLLPAHIRLFGPDGYGDGHLLGDWNRKYRSRDKLRGWCGSYFETFSKVPRSHVHRFPGDYVSPLYTIYVKEGGQSDSQNRLCSPIHWWSGSPLLDQTTGLDFNRDGRPMWSLPGTRGYRRVLIYTFA